MPQLLKQLNLKILLFAMAIIAMTIAGCRLGGDFYGDDASAKVGEATLSLGGNVLVDPDALSSLRAKSKSFSGALLPADLGGYIAVAGADVWIEELPDFPHQTTDSKGLYLFQGLPPGNYRVVSSFLKPDLTTMKVRSNPIEIVTSNEIATAPALALASANKVVTGVMRDASGDFLPAGTVLILWGEKFIIEEDGKFTSPALPDDVEMADIIVARPEAAVIDRPVIPVQFFSAEEPTTVEMQVGSAEDDFRPFSASMNVKINGVAVSEVNVIQNTDLVDLALNLTGLDRNTAGITYEWDSGRGNFSSYPTVTDSAIWIAPSTSGMAVISVKISAPGRGSFKVALPLVVDVPVKAPKFALTFDSQNGNSVAAQSIEAGAKAIEPAPPTRAAYKFAGWYKEVALTNQWNFLIDKVTAATTVYARWIAESTITYRLNFAAQGGSPVAAQTIESGNLAAEPAAPIRTGYAFAGWFKEIELTNQWNFAVDTLTVETIVYAKWVAEALPSFRLTFNSQGGSRVTSQIIKSGTKAFEPAAPILAGYDLVGWYKELSLQNQWNFVTESITADTTLYAKWIPATVPSFRVTFDPQGGSTVTIQTIKSGAQAIKPTAPIRTGYDFAGWYKEVTKTNQWDFATDLVNANTILYAKWIAATIPTVVVTFDSQGGSAIASQTVESGAKAVEPVAPTRAAYTFAGWYKEVALTNQWNFATDLVNANTILYAKWIVTQYVLNYLAGANGTITGNSSQTVPVG
ncbi:MAG: InlB B-repeat-containing protein, partial [Candidatus Riflebacteria bacterium]|nr:InlB B-repeat-containing protein [Candidatus Riflebacteria bacterium]